MLTDYLLAGPVMVGLREPEVCEPNFATLDQYVGRFDVSVNDIFYRDWKYSRSGDI